MFLYTTISAVTAVIVGILLAVCTKKSQPDQQHSSGLPLCLPFAFASVPCHDRPSRL